MLCQTAVMSAEIAALVANCPKACDGKVEFKFLTPYCSCAQIAGQLRFGKRGGYPQRELFNSFWGVRPR